MAVGDTFALTPSESVTVAESSPERLVVEGTWGPGGKPPPSHYHPNQAERFTVLEGELRFKVGSADRALGAGEEIEVSVGTSHQVWNPGGAPARARWVTEPAGRTESWFRAIDAANREAGEGQQPSALAFAPLLREYGDTFRLSGPAPLVGVAVAGLAAVGRLLGHRPA